MNNLTNQTQERLIKYIEVIGDCWLWQGAKTRLGIGMTTLDGVTTTAKKAVYTVWTGESPIGNLKSNCSEVACINPKHQSFRKNPPRKKRQIKKKDPNREIKLKYLLGG